MNPTRIGGYEILAELGRGAMGVVYHARDAAIGRAVAIKVIRIDSGTSSLESAELRQRLIREASVAGKLYHPGIVTVHQLGEDGDNVFIVMEFVEGSSLERLLSHNPSLDHAWALDILAQVAVALDYAHKAGVVHRDIKPANILVRADGRVKIADFGIAKLTTAATTGMTATGVSIGSPAYMSPEQIQATEIDGRSDQFALATIAFQMLAGRMPFKGSTAHSLMFQIVTADPFAPQPGDTPIPPAVRAILARALSKRAPDRFLDCASFIQELTNAVGGAAPVTTTVMVAPPNPPTKESKSWMLLPILGGLLTVGLLGAGIYYYLNAPAPIAVATTAPTSTPSRLPTPTPAPTPAATKPSAPKPAADPTPAMSLLGAVTYGKVDVAKSLLAKGANVNEADAGGSTPLMLASEGNAYLPYNLPMVQLLIDARASLEARDSQGRTALDRAIAEGKTDVAGLLIASGALVNTKSNNGATPLLYAVQYGKIPLVQLLIAHHAQVDAADAAGNTPLMIASEGTAYLPNNTPLVQALLNAGAKVDLLDPRGRSALHRASAEPKPDAVRLLLEHHANPNLRANDGSTPLIQAVTYARTIVVQVLLNHRADVNLADANGTTPLMVAAEKSAYIKDPAKFIKMLLDHGAKRDARDTQGRTASQRARESGNTAAIALLK